MNRLKPKPRKTTAFWRAMTSHCGSLSGKVEEIKRHGVSGGKAILLARKISTPAQWNHFQRVERPFLHDQQMRRRALGREA